VREAFEAGLRSFVNEAQVLAHFDHPALAKVFRFWEQHGTAYMAMPYYEGVTLKQVLQKSDTPPTEAWLHWIFGPLLEAIELLHEENYFHRDIAPDNVMILHGGAPLLLDFGAARHVIGDMTQELTAILKPGYAPVEQYADTVSMRQGPWTDIYAIAAVLYRAVTGRVPMASVGRLMSDDLRPVAQAALRAYSTQLLAGIQAGLAIKPPDRPQSIAEFRRLLGYQSVPSPLRPTAALDAEAPTRRPAPEQQVSISKERPPIFVQKEARLPAPSSRDRNTLPAAARGIHWRGLLLAGVLVIMIAAAWVALRPDGARVPTHKTVLPPVSGEQGGPALPPVRPDVEPPPAPVAVPKVPASEPSFAGRPKSARVPVPTPPRKTASDRNCVELLEQLSLGVDTPELRAKLQSLNCPGSH
jgi:hypothetical protein